MVRLQNLSVPTIARFNACQEKKFSPAKNFIRNLISVLSEPLPKLIPPPLRKHSRMALCPSFHQLLRMKTGSAIMSMQTPWPPKLPSPWVHAVLSTCRMSPVCFKIRKIQILFSPVCQSTMSIHSKAKASSPKECCPR